MDEPIWRKRRLVFVDPDDPKSNSFWWAALIVPHHEVKIFKETADRKIKELGESDHLVCYMEDGSYSIVSEKDVKEFHPDKEPYLQFKQKYGDKFENHPSVVHALAYFHKGIWPRGDAFRWLDKVTKLGREEKVAEYTPEGVSSGQAPTDSTANSMDGLVPRKSKPRDRKIKCAGCQSTSTEGAWAIADAKKYCHTCITLVNTSLRESRENHTASPIANDHIPKSRAIPEFDDDIASYRLLAAVLPQTRQMKWRARVLDP